MTEFERLYLQHKAEFSRYAHFLTFKGGFEAEPWRDVLQEASIKMFLNFDKFKIGTSFIAWGKKVMFNQYITMYRKESMMNIENLTEHNFISTKNEESQNTEEEEMCIWLGLFEELLSDEVIYAINNIRPEYKPVIILRYICGYNEKETASLLNIPLQHVKNRSRRARVAMSAFLTDYSKPNKFNACFPREFKLLHEFNNVNFKNKKQVAELLVATTLRK